MFHIAQLLRFVKRWCRVLVSHTHRCEQVGELHTQLALTDASMCVKRWPHPPVALKQVRSRVQKCNHRQHIQWLVKRDYDGSFYYFSCLVNAVRVGLLTIVFQVWDARCEMELDSQSQESALVDLFEFFRLVMVWFGVFFCCCLVCASEPSHLSSFPGLFKHKKKQTTDASTLWTRGGLENGEVHLSCMWHGKG